jgi:hypothetical protein
VRQPLGHRFEIVQRQSQLLNLILALRAPGRLAGRLHGGQQQRHEHADNGDDDQELNQREPDHTTRRGARGVRGHMTSLQTAINEHHQRSEGRTDSPA